MKSATKFGHVYLFLGFFVHISQFTFSAGVSPITMKPKNQTVKEGTAFVLFHCRIITEAEFAKYTWYV